MCTTVFAEDADPYNNRTMVPAPAATSQVLPAGIFRRRTHNQEVLPLTPFSHPDRHSQMQLQTSGCPKRYFYISVTPSKPHSNPSVPLGRLARPIRREPRLRDPLAERDRSRKVPSNAACCKGVPCAPEPNALRPGIGPCHSVRMRKERDCLRQSSLGIESLRWPGHAKASVADKVGTLHEEHVWFTLSTGGAQYQVVVEGLVL